MQPKNRRERRAMQRMRDRGMNAKKAKVRLIVLKSYAETDREIARSLPKDISCRRGCGACCRQLQAVSLLEALYIVDNNQARVLAVLETLRKHDRLLEELDAGRSSLANTYDENASAMSQLASAWWESGEQCAFFSPLHNECTIYKDRPLACRTHYVSSDPAACGDPRPGVEVTIWNPPVRVKSGIEMLEANARFFEGDAPAGSMPSVILIAARMLGLIPDAP